MHGLTTGVLLLHGLTGMPSELRPLARYLKQRGFDTASPLLAGHGGSHYDLLNVTWRDWVASSREALSRLLERVDQVVICGLSMGATIGAILAVEDTRVVGVVMLSPTLSYDGSAHAGWLQGLLKLPLVQHVLHIICSAAPVLGRVFYWTETPPYGLKDERLQRQITRAIEAAKHGQSNQFGLFRTYFGSLLQMNLLTDEFKRLAPKVYCPVLIMHSREDTLASLSNATATCELLSGTNKRLEVLTGCDHVLTLDLQRDYVCQLIEEFINDVVLVLRLEIPCQRILSTRL